MKRIGATASATAPTSHEVRHEPIVTFVFLPRAEDHVTTRLLGVEEVTGCLGASGALALHGKRLLGVVGARVSRCPTGRRRTSTIRDVSPQDAPVWDVLRVAPAVVRSFEAGPEGLDVICIGGRKPKEGDTERFEDFWD